MKKLTIEEALPREIKRCTELLWQYAEVAALPGVFEVSATARIKASIDRAVDAQATGDIAAMVWALEELRGCI